MRTGSAPVTMPARKRVGDDLSEFIGSHVPSFETVLAKLTWGLLPV
jgi:hypothetical protein